jgi:hypothetical protein
MLPIVTESCRGLSLSLSQPLYFLSFSKESTQSKQDAFHQQASSSSEIKKIVMIKNDFTSLVRSSAVVVQENEKRERKKISLHDCLSLISFAFV